MFRKHYEIVTDVDKLNVDIQKVIMEHKTIKQWAYIVHDKDDTRPHYHIYVNFGESSLEHTKVAEWFGVPDNLVNTVKGRKSDMLTYLIHGQENQKHKFQYNLSEVKSNINVGQIIEESKMLGDFNTYSYARQLDYVHSLNPEDRLRASKKLRDLWKNHCEWLALGADRSIEVVFIYGEKGTGKTTYAKRMLDKLGYDYCVSSSSNDPFQDYLGQDAIIMDDLRDDVFGFADILKILDNHTSSSYRSRFSNKVFNGKMIVITTVIPLKEWYKGINRPKNSKDSLSQLYRRITHYIEIDKEFIKLYDSVNSISGEPKNRVGILENRIAKKFEKIVRKKTDLYEIIDDVNWEDDPEDESGEATQDSIEGFEKPIDDKKEDEEK